MKPFLHDNNVLDPGAVVVAGEYTLLLGYVHEPGHHVGHKETHCCNGPDDEPLPSASLWVLLMISSGVPKKQRGVKRGSDHQ